MLLLYNHIVRLPGSAFSDRWHLLDVHVANTILVGVLARSSSWWLDASSGIDTGSSLYTGPKFVVSAIRYSGSPTVSRFCGYGGGRTVLVGCDVRICPRPSCYARCHKLRAGRAQSLSVWCTNCIGGLGCRALTGSGADLWVTRDHKHGLTAGSQLRINAQFTMHSQVGCCVAGNSITHPACR
jgi:hypothetical protein